LAYPERLWRALKKPPPDASRQAWMAVRVRFLERKQVGLESRFAAQLVKVQRAERRPELLWRAAEPAGALAQKELPQAVRRWMEAMAAGEPPLQMEPYARLAQGQVRRAWRVPQQAEQVWTLRLPWPPLPPLPHPQVDESAFEPARHAQYQESSNESFSR
jgi:hypothetical protein